MVFLPISIDSSKEMFQLVQKASSHERNLYLHNGNSTQIVNAKSLLGVMYARFKFDELYLVAQYSIPEDMLKFRRQ